MIYLASASPRRHELLCQAGIAHKVLKIPSPPGEDEPRLPDEAPEAYVRRTAHEKALRAMHWLGASIDAALADWPESDQLLPLLPVLTADTTVCLGDEILGKPRNATDAARMLKRLSGTQHEVLTAVVLAVPNTDNNTIDIVEDLSRTLVKFKVLSDAEILAYCSGGEPMGKAGAYAIQGRAGTFVEHLQGSYSGVVGLPLFETANLLQRKGLAL